MELNKSKRSFLEKGGRRPEFSGELLILSNGTVLAHDLFPELAAVLLELNPGDQDMLARLDLVKKGIDETSTGN